MRLVYMSPVPWESFAQRPHKFVEWFHGRTGEPVLWVDPYPTRFPAWGDFRRPRLSGLSSQRGTVPTWLTLCKPCLLPIEPIPSSGWVNRIFWMSCMRAISDFVEGGRTLLAIGKPSVLALELLKRFYHCPSLYDAMDDFPAFYVGLSHFAMARRERKITQRVDVILASSSELKSRWANIHKDVRLVHNGLDMLAVKAVVPTAMPSKNKVFGYVGTIASWFDWEWIRALADARPKDEIRLIGPVFQPPLRELPDNVKILAACDQPSALRAMAHFDVGIIPFKKNLLTASVDPIKYYEYRVFGLPVMSSGFGEMGLREGESGVFITHSLNDVPAMAEAAMSFELSANDCCDFAVKNSWKSRFDEANIFS